METRATSSAAAPADNPDASNPSGLFHLNDSTMRTRSTSSRLALAAFVGALWAAGAALAAAPMPAAAPASAAMPPAMPPHGQMPPMAKKPPAKPVKRIDINSASKAELKKLPYIGDAEADRIIANRPFKTKADLVNLKIIETGPYVSIKNRIVATQKAPPKAKAKAKDKA